MRKILRLVAATLLAIPAVSYACATNESLIFSCTTKKMKAVEVCDAKKTIKYSYGKKDSTPELVLSVPRNEVTTTQWSGIGSSMYYDVSIPNGKTVYTVYWDAEKDAEEGEVSAGISVDVDGKNAADVQCDMKTVEQNLEGVELRQAE